MAAEGKLFQKVEIVEENEKEIKERGGRKEKKRKKKWPPVVGVFSNDQFT
jgi:hypothetical protein